MNNLDNPLSADDIKKYFGGRCKVISYNQLQKYNDINELLHPYDKVFILYVWEKTGNNLMGHWQLVFRNKDNNIEVFDSFGSWIDSFLNKIGKSFNNEIGQNYKYLSKLLYDSNHIIEYNDTVLQNEKSNTCGKWCIYRLKNIHLDIDDFCKLFGDNTLNNDRLILKIFSN